MKRKKVLVVGAGQMGAGIAQIMASSGREVRLFDVQEGAAEEAKEKTVARLKKRERRGKCVDGTTKRVKELLCPQTECNTKGVGLVVEAIVEDQGTKEELFSRLGESADPGTILASNTSSLSIDLLARASGRPGETIGMHFMNPVPVMPLVEIIAGKETKREVLDEIVSLAIELGKKPVISQDLPGFISNRVLMPMINEAIRAREEGVGTVEAIDTVMELGMRHPLGPLKLADLIGLDTCLAILNVLHEGLEGKRHQPAQLLVEMVKKGDLGRKSGKGFYEYD
ncbi:3-hydroxybutyryl-CoA dehydrogenase [bacterium]|nr:3-hydroxybutyryl-CoA dehydrogenase [bacterium]